MAAPSTWTLETRHEGLVLDVKMNLIGTNFVTASEDHSLRIFNINRNESSQTMMAQLIGHVGPVVSVDWAHPRFGEVLASCSVDKKVIIWREYTELKDVEANAIVWEPEYVFEGHDASVNGVSWAPPEWGLTVACGSSDGSISILTHEPDGWSADKIDQAHMHGCNSVSWPPSPSPGVPTSGQLDSPRFVSAGSDKWVKIWRKINYQWLVEAKLEAHTECVRNVAWSPCTEAGTNIIASSTDDGRLIVWTQKEGDGVIWTPLILNIYADTVNKLVWDLVGNVLTVSSGGNQMSVWKQQATGKWECTIFQRFVVSDSLNQPTSSE